MIKAEKKDDLLRKVINPPGNQYRFMPKTDMEKAIVSELLADFMITASGDYLQCTITQRGLDFLDSGGYAAVAEKELKEESEAKSLQKTESTLNIKKLRRDKFIAPIALVISGISLLVAIASFIVASCR